LSRDGHVPQIDALSAARRVEDGATLLDVREDDEWQAGHAPAAHHVVMQQVPERYGTLPQDVEIVVVCRSGGRSQRVAEFLRAQGFEAVNLAGGMRAWAEGGLPVQTSNGTSGEVI